jgi:signal transduction histidine kinase
MRGGHAAVQAEGLRATGRDEWRRFVPVWHALFGALVALTAVLVAVDGGIGPVARIVALCLLGASILWYALAGGAGLRREAGERYLAVAAPLTIALMAAAPIGALLLFVLYPHVWAMLRPRRAVPVTVAVVAAVVVVVVAQQGWDGPAVAAALVTGAVSLLFSLLLGLWISRIIRQSKARAELAAELAATRAELAALSHEAGVRAERERLASEIHDTLAQGFTSVLLLLEAMETALDTDPAAARRHLDRARETARENLAEARAFVAALSPPDLGRTSLPEALRRLVERAGVESELVAGLAVTGDPHGLPAEHEVALLRAAQEALTNVRRHASASRVDVTLGYEPDAVRLRVRDDGCGFDPDAAANGGYGLAGMRARAARIGGAVNVLAAPGVGVAVCFEVPVL